MSTEPTIIPQEPWMNGESYYRFACKECGEEATNKYVDPIRKNLLDRQLCYMCNHWHEFEQKLGREHSQMTIIGGHVYSPGNRTSGEMRDMAGRRFDIEYVAPSIYSGQRVSTFDLWSGSTMPDSLKEKYPDTAVFLNGAERCKVGDTGCWEPSSNKTEPYPLPIKLRATAPKAEAHEDRVDERPASDLTSSDNTGDEAWPKIRLNNSEKLSKKPTLSYASQELPIESSDFTGEGPTCPSRTKPECFLSTSHKKIETGPEHFKSTAAGEFKPCLPVSKNCSEETLPSPPPNFPCRPSQLLTPPAKCLAIPALPMADRRKGAIWHCPHARKNIGKGRKQPDCLCRAALDAAMEGRS